MSDVKTVKSFMKNYLPEKILKQIDLENIVMEKDSFIEEELKEVFSDILYKVGIDDQQAYLYFIFEHKSYPYREISLQLLNYMTKIWKLKLRQNSSNKLPLIVPLVIYHGEQRWNIDLNLSGILQQIPFDLKEYVPDYKYLIFDLSTYSEDQIKGEAKLRVFFELITAIYQGDFGDRFKKALLILEELEDKKTAVGYFKTIFIYAINAQEDVTVQELSNIAKEISSERSDQIMSIAEKLKEEGREEGKKQGKEEGKKEGMLELVEKQLFRKFKSVPEEYRRKLKEQDKAKLEVIATEILEMEDITDLEDYFK